MATTSLKLDATCPKDSPSHARCASCLREQMRGMAGIRNVDLICKEGDTQAVLELDYDPRLVSLNDLTAETLRAGACLSPTRAQVVLGVEGMVSPRSEQAVERALAKLPGVTASASYASHSLRVEFDRRTCALPEIVRRLDDLGLRLRPGGPVPVVPDVKPTLAHRLRDTLKEYHKLAMAIAGAVLLVIAFSTHLLDGPPALRYVAVALCYVIAGWYTAIDTFWVLRQFRFDIDVLMFAAAFGAASLGHYEEGGLLLVLFALGGAGEELAMDRARQAINALAKLAPDVATVRDSLGQERQVRVADLVLNDRVVVRPFDRVPADGSVVSGSSEIDQSPITGESVPVAKSAGDPVFAGTMNGEGLLIVGVTKLSSESTLAKIVRLVAEAQTTKSPTQVFTDKVEKMYVPLVLLGTAVLIVLPPLLGFHPRREGTLWAGWFYQAMAFLTAASPCALAIGTPAAVLSGIARAARLGVLVKGGVHLENLGRVRAVAFDKTGTLTRGRPDVTDVIPLGDEPADRIITLAAAVERGSTHPIAVAIVDDARHRGCPTLPADDVQQIAAQGVNALVESKRVFVGRAAAANGGGGPLVAALGQLSSQGKTIVLVTVDEKPIGLIGLSDKAREAAPASLRRLKALGIERTIMLTGDRQSVADTVGREIGIDEYHGDLLPQDKLDRIRELESRFGPIAMIGDGVNDAPALAVATVGIAMGGAGTDVAIETADVALMADDLSKLPDAIGLSRFSRKIIKQNLVIALGVISVLAPSAALGIAPLGLAVLFHEGSTVVVVLNSMRLLVYKPR